MNIRLLSDLHLEAAAFDPPEAAADVVILAGDIDNGGAGVAWAQLAFDAPVLYVPGNHEFYDHEFADALDQIRSAARGSPVAVLDCAEYVQDGVRFLGCTLWTDFDIDGPEGKARAFAKGDWLVDYRAIRWGDRLLLPDDTIALHRRHRAWLGSKLQEPFDGKTVVVTHHAPHRGSIAQGFAQHPLNPAFVSDLDALMGPAVLWLHGHTHTAFDYTVRGTRVVCNPRGYPGEDTGFSADLILDV